MPSDIVEERPLTMSLAVVGGLLGLGAPVGWILIRAAQTSGLQPSLLAWFVQEILGDPFLYVYLSIGTTVSFAAFGGLAGWMLDHLRKDSAELTASRVRLMKEAVTDFPTGLYNRRCFEEQLQEQVERAGRDDRGFALLFIDIDDFRSLNDRYGALVAERVVTKAAELLRETAGDNPRVFRYGGDKYAVLLPGGSRESASALKTAIMRTLSEKVHSKVPMDTPLSVSVGMTACAPRQQTTLGAMMSEVYRSMEEFRKNRSGHST